jgi:hypothetical protein
MKSRGIIKRFVIERLVTEKIMGWKWLEPGRAFIEDVRKSKFFNPTSSITDAWVILDQFDDYELCGTPSKNEYQCKVKKDDKWFSAVSYNSQALAICLAALKAVGVKGKENEQ